MSQFKRFVAALSKVTKGFFFYPEKNCLSSLRLISLCLNIFARFLCSIPSSLDKPGLFTTSVIPGGVADRAGVKVNDRLLEINGENIEDYSHDQAADKLTLAGGSVMFLLVDEETDEYCKKKRIEIGTQLATVKYLPHKPRIIDITKGSDGYGFLLREMPKQTGKDTIICQSQITAISMKIKQQEVFCVLTVCSSTAGHFIKDIDRGSPAERAGVKEMDRIVAVNGKPVDGCSHEQVVDRIRQCGNKCCLLVVDNDTDQMYKLVSQGAVV